MSDTKKPEVDPRKPETILESWAANLDRYTR